MVTTTARQLITNALKLLAVLDPSEAADAADAQDSFWSLNSLIDSWGTQRLTMYTITQTRTTAASGDTSYTIGDTTPASDFDQPLPLWIESARYVVPSSDPEVTVALPVITNQMFQAQPVPELENSLPTTLYYQPTSGTVGQIVLWPVLTQAVDIILFTPTAITQFPDYATSVVLPTGYERAIRYNLALELAPLFTAVPSPGVIQNARTALGDIKRVNTRPVDLRLDAGLVGGPSLWNINTGP